MVFKIGQKVTSTHKDGWVHDLSFWQRLRGLKEESHIYPSYGEVVTIETIEQDGCLIFEEYTEIFDGYRESYEPEPFRPIITISKTAKETAELANTFINEN